MHDWRLVHRDDGFRGRLAIPQSTVGSFGVVVVPPTFDDDLGLTERVEDFSVQQLGSHPSIEILAVSDLPGRLRLDICRLDLNPCLAGDASHR